MMQRAYTFRMYPRPSHVEWLEGWFSFTREIYNAALQERRDAYRKQRICVSWQDQSNEITDLKHLEPWFSEWMGKYPRSSVTETLKTLNRAYQAFFRRVKAGQKPGYPKFRSGKHPEQSATAQSGMRYDAAKQRLLVKGMEIPVNQHRPLPDGAKVKMVVVKRNHSRWLVTLQCDIPDRSLRREKATGEPVGIDVGLKSFAALSDGTLVGNPGWLDRELVALRVAQRRMARSRKGSSRWRKAKDEVARIHGRVAARRKDWIGKLSREIVGGHAVVCVEDLRVSNMVRSRSFARRISDAAWSMFRADLEYKSPEHQGKVVAVPPRNTSQECSECGVLVPKGLSERTHSCACGCVLDRDVNAARVILKRGLALV